MSKSIEKNIASVNMGVDEFTTGLKQLALITVDAVNNKHIQDRSLEFFGTAKNTPYDKGLMWTGVGNAKLFVLQSNPDRFHSNIGIDLAANACFSIDKTSVLSTTELGRTVVDSNLKKVGTLKNLNTIGSLNINSFIVYDPSTNRLCIGKSIGNAVFSVANNSVEFIVEPGATAADIGTYTNSGLNIRTDNTDRISITSNGNISLGLKGNTETKINMYGRVGIGVTSVESDVSLSTSGAVKFQNKKFEVGPNIPSTGVYNKGDIVWNENPIAGSNVGWICVVSGTPGQWKTFGAISN